jgi:PKD repeat protein
MNEYLSSPDLRRRFPLLILAVVFALLLTLLLVVTGYAGRPGVWRATEFQVQNLDDETALITARFYDPHGLEVLSFNDSIAPGASAYYQPELPPYNLPTTFTGTLIVSSEQIIAGAIVHLASPTPPHHNGVTVYETFDEAELGPRAYAPLVEKDNDGFGSWVGVSNLGDVTATVTVTIYDPAGSIASTWSGQASPRGLVELNVGAIEELPVGFVGAAAIQASQPILAQVSRSNGTALASYSTPGQGGNELAAPLVPGASSGAVTPALATQNLGDQPSVVAQAFGAGCDTCPCRIITLDPGGSDFVTRPYTASAPLYIFNDDEQPVASVVTVGSAQAGAAGVASYAAFDVARLGQRAAVPLAFGGYEGWYTRLWVQNLGTTTATVDLTYTLLISPGSSAFSAHQAILGPGQTTTFPPPAAPHASAIAWADQPIAVLVEGYNDSLALEDSRFYYRATPYGPPSARFATDSPVQLGQTIYFENLSEAVPPVHYRWDFGDGSVSDKENPAHTYAASGAYTVVMTATNLYGSVAVSDMVEVYGPPLAGFESSRPDPLRQAIFFINTSTALPGITGYQWDFGDGSTGNQENPIHDYAIAGRYWVVLTATNAYGGDTFIDWVIVPHIELHTLYLPLVLKTSP